MKHHAIALVTAAALASAGCFEIFNKTAVANPSDVTVNLLGGVWSTSGSTAGTLAASCTNFTWTVSEHTSTSGSGTFGATCFGDMQVTGMASGTLSGNTLSWTAKATATVPGFPACDVQLSGTATLAGTDTISIPYAGTTCVGAVSGTEILKKK